MVQAKGDLDTANGLLQVARSQYRTLLEPVPDVGMEAQRPAQPHIDGGGPHSGGATPRTGQHHDRLLQPYLRNGAKQSAASMGTELSMEQHLWHALLSSVVSALVVAVQQ